MPCLAVEATHVHRNDIHSRVGFTLPLIDLNTTAAKTSSSSNNNNSKISAAGAKLNSKISRATRPNTYPQKLLSSINPPATGMYKQKRKCKYHRYWGRKISIAPLFSFDESILAISNFSSGYGLSFSVIEEPCYPIFIRKQRLSCLVVARVMIAHDTPIVRNFVKCCNGLVLTYCFWALSAISHYCSILALPWSDKWSRTHNSRSSS